MEVKSGESAIQPETTPEALAARAEQLANAVGGLSNGRNPTSQVM